jgi:hypothetical protein
MPDSSVGYDVAAHQKIEIKHARTIAASLSIPIKMVTAFDSESLTDALAGIITHHP